MNKMLDYSSLYNTGEIRYWGEGPNCADGLHLPPSRDGSYTGAQMREYAWRVSDKWRRSADDLALQLNDLHRALTRLFALDLENDEATPHWPELQECLGAVDLAMRWPQGRPPAPGDEQCDDNPGLPTIGA